MAGTVKIQRLGWSLEWMQRISEKGNENLGQLGYTDHSQKHCMQVAHQGGKILKKLGYSEHEIELAQIAGYMHDIGNVINRSHPCRVRCTSCK